MALNTAYESAGPTCSVGSTNAASERSARIASVDILRGFVMAIMALDHTRDFFSNTGFNPRDVTEPALFLTRWVTHICAPTFIFLSGLSAFLYGRGRTVWDLSRFLLTRGIWLILMDFTLIKFGWRFDFDVLRMTGGIIFAIGGSMIALSAIVWLPRWLIAGLTLLIIIGHNLFDSIRAHELGDATWAWHVLHEPGRIDLGDQATFYVLYPLLPWIGVMAAGYLLGPVMQLEPHFRQRVLFRLGAAITLGFIVLRATNIYGDPASWVVQETLLETVLSFLNCEKYPPSLLYLMMTIGPALMLLASFERTQGPFTQFLSVFGQVPLFYYVIHIYLIHLLAVATAFATTGDIVRIPELGFNLAGVYLVWVLVLIMLYPICRWFADLKSNGRGWWWSYL